MQSKTDTAPDTPAKGSTPPAPTEAPDTPPTPVAGPEPEPEVEPEVDDDSPTMPEVAGFAQVRTASGELAWVAVFDEPAPELRA